VLFVARTMPDEPTPSRAILYVDGFNLYHGALKRAPELKWLNLSALARHLLKSSVVKVRYFTAMVESRPEDPEQTTRQGIYLRALATTPDVTVHFGQFKSHEGWARLVEPDGERRCAYVLKTREKGSDVNLASFLLVDASDNLCDVAAVVSNDSDLATPVELVRSRFGKTVIAVHPRRRPTKELAKVASFVMPLRRAAMEACQFPDEMADAAGTFHRPSVWAAKTKPTPDD